MIQSSVLSHRESRAAVPSASASPSAPPLDLDSITAALCQPATNEDFRAHRRREAQQETLSLRSRGFGPICNQPEPAEQAQPDPQDPPRQHGPGPYSEDLRRWLWILSY